MKNNLSDKHDDRVVLVSFRRSGLNWVRYCIELFSNKRTPGKLRLIKFGYPIIQRTHDVDCFDLEQYRDIDRYKNRDIHGYEGCNFYDEEGRQVFSKMVLLLRDYRESYVRAAKMDKSRMSEYVSNLKAYHNFAGDKILVRYEDLIKDFSEMEKILDFIKIKRSSKKFDLECHRKKSIAKYDKTNKSYTKDNVLDFSYHAKTLDQKQIDEIDMYMEEITPKDVYNEYLRSYRI